MHLFDHTFDHDYFFELPREGERDTQSISRDRIALTRAMKDLPAGYRTILVLHEVKGYEHHEIARLLSCSIGNSKSQLHKAKAKMRDLLHLQKSQNGRCVSPAKASNDDRLSGSVDRIALTRAMKELPSGYRTIFVLHDVKAARPIRLANTACQ